MDNFGQMLSASLADVDLSNPINYNHPLAKGLVGFWLPLPSLAGGTKLYDLTRYRTHGTLTNMDPRTDWVVGRRTYRLSFDATLNQYIELASVAFGSGSSWPSFTQAVAVVPFSISSSIRCIYRSKASPNHGLYHYSDNMLHNEAGTEINVSVTPGSSYHVVYTQGTANLGYHKWFVNSVETDNVNSRETASNDIVRICGDWWSQTFDGQLLYFMQWANRDMSNLSVSELYEEAIGGFPTLLNRTRLWLPASAAAPSQTLLDYERGFRRGFSRGISVGTC